MASTLQQYRQLADHMATQITGSYQSWTDFLTTAARLYKYPYHEQLMIYAQRPDATACAEYDLWNNRMGRYIRRGAKGIALIDHSGDAPKLKYVFDVADTRSTGRSRSPYLWEYRPEHEEVVSNALGQQYSIQYNGDFADQLEQISSVKVTEYFLAHEQDLLGIVDGSYLERYHDYDKGVAFLNAATVSTTYMLLSRCGLAENTHFGPEDFMPVFDFNTPQTVDALGSAISGISEEILRTIEVTIKKYEREKLSERSQDNERTDLHTQRGLLDSQSESVPPGEQAPGQVRTDAESIPSGAAPGAVEPADSLGEAVPPSAGDRRNGEPALGADDAGADAVGGRDGGAESQRPHEMGGTDEQPESAGGGNNPRRADLRLNEHHARGGQLSFFPTEAEQIAYIAEAENVAQTSSAFSVSQEQLDHVLRLGGNADDTRMVIAVTFQKQKPLENIAALLQGTFHGGNGFKTPEGELSAWYAADSIHIAPGRSAEHIRSAQVIAWQDAAARISQLMDSGAYASNVELAEAGQHERMQLAQALWYLKHDLSDEAREQGYLSCMDTLRGGGFPDETERLAERLTDSSFRDTLSGEFAQFYAAHEQDRSLLRFHYHKLENIWQSLRDLSLPRREYSSEMTAVPELARFITEDEIDHALDRGSGVEGGKGRIYEYFTADHTGKEKAAFLKVEYGIGGRSHAVSGASHSDESHDSRGIVLKKAGCANVELSWTKVAARIDSLIQKDRFLSPREKERYAQLQREKEAERELPTQAQTDYNAIKEAHPDDIVLFQVGDFFEIYGEDAKQAAELLDLNLTTREIPGAGRVEMCGVPSHNLEMYVEKLRDKYDVTIAEAPDFRGERHIYTLRSIDHEAEAAINAYEAEFGADGTRVFRDPAAEQVQPTVAELFEGYKLTVGNALIADDAFLNACRNSDRQNAYLEGAAAIRRIVTESGDLQLTRLYFDMPAFHNRLHQELLDELYPTLATTVTPSPYKVTQEDIDAALQQWNGRIESKHAVVRYMKAHARDRDTAAWLAREYGLKDTSKPLQLSVGNSEPVTLSWAKVQRRIAQLIQSDNFYTEQEQDNFDNIDPIAIREALAERGIVGGRIVDAEANRNSPFIRQVMADVERIAVQEARMDAPNRFSIRLYPNEGGITGIWDSALDRFYEEGGQVLRFAEQSNAINYLSKIQHRRGIELDAPVFTTPLGIAYRVGDVFSSTAAGQRDTLMVIERVDEDNIWYTLPSVPEQTPVSVDRTTFERYFDTGYFTATEQKEMTIDPAERFHVVGLDRGFRTLYAVWDDETHGYYVDSEGVTEEFTSEWQAEAYRLELQGKAEQALMERAKGLISEFCQCEYGSEADFSDMAKIGVAYTTVTDDEIPIQVNIDLVNYRLERYLDDEHLETRQYSSLQGLIDNELESLDFSDLIHVSDDELESHRWHEPEEPAESEKLNNNPFNRMVMEDVQRISDEEFARENLIPDETTFEIDGRTFLVDRVNLDSRSVNFQDITFSNATGFPIFRTESIAFVRKYVEEQEKQSVQPETSAETVAVYSGEKNNLPYDVVVQTLRTEETTPPVQSMPVSIPIDGKWQEFPSVADAEQASYEEYKENLRRNAHNFRIMDDGLGTGGPKAKFQANMAAIRLLKNLEQEGLQASPEQQEILSRYVGWGGLPDAFDESKPTWSGEFAELRSTLTPKEYTAARASTLNAHYTSPTVIRAIYEVVGNMGFQAGNILEPSMGVGNFFGMLPEEMQSSRLYGVELDSISGRIARQLYPNANITIGGFETTERKDFFDLAIGNVPFGQYKVNDPAYNKLGFNIHNYFFGATRS